MTQNALSEVQEHATLRDMLDTVRQGDAVQCMGELPDECVDLIIADPPYNLSKGGQWSWDNSADLPGLGGDWDKMMEDWDAMPFQDYWAFTHAWLVQAKRVLKDTGSIWVHGTYHNIGVINVLFQLLDIEIINEIIWYKRNAFPNLSGRRLTASHETILWGHTGGNRRSYYFDYEAMKSSAFPEDNLKQPGKQLRTVWDIPTNKRPEERQFGTNPAQKPLRLLERMILCSSRPGAVCLAPFTGAGSECVAAKLLGRHFVGFEISADYVNIARARLEDTDAIPYQHPLPAMDTDFDTDVQA